MADEDVPPPSRRVGHRCAIYVHDDEHAMKGTDRGRMLAAIVGKALQPLEGERGVILVLVTLQLGIRFPPCDRTRRR